MITSRQIEPDLLSALEVHVGVEEAVGKADRRRLVGVVVGQEDAQLPNAALVGRVLGALEAHREVVLVGRVALHLVALLQQLGDVAFFALAGYQSLVHKRVYYYPNYFLLYVLF